MTLKEKNRTETLLSPENIDPRILEDLGIDLISDISLISPVEPEAEVEPPIQLVDRILQANRELESLQALRTKALGDEDSEFTLEDGLLLY